MRAPRQHRIDPAYIERVGIREFLAPALSKVPGGSRWAEEAGFALHNLSDTAAVATALAHALNTTDVPDAVVEMLVQCESLAEPAAFESLLSELREWGNNPPAPAESEYNLPLWAYVHAGDVLQGAIDRRFDGPQRRLSDFVLRAPRPTSRKKIAQSAKTLQTLLEAGLKERGRSEFCRLALHSEGEWSEIYIHHATTKKVRTLVDDRHIGVADLDPVQRREQRDKVLMFAALCERTSRLRVSVRYNGDANLLRAAFGQALFRDADAYLPFERFDLSGLLVTPLAAPPPFASARLAEFEGDNGAGWRAHVRHRDVHRGANSAPIDLRAFSATSAKFYVKPAKGRDLSIEVRTPNSLRYAKALSQHDVETFLAMNGLLRPEPEE